MQKRVILLIEAALASVNFIDGIEISMKVGSFIVMVIVAVFAIRAHIAKKRREDKQAMLLDQQIARQIEENLKLKKQ